MGFFEKVKRANIVDRKAGDSLYTVVAKEMEEGWRHEGQWIKALELSGGNKEKQVAEYIKLRVQSLKDDVEIMKSMPSDDWGVPAAEPKAIQRDPISRQEVEEFSNLLRQGVSLDRLDEVERAFGGSGHARVKELLNTFDSLDDYPIHITIKAGMLEQSAWLLERGASPWVKNYWGKTPLEIAEKHENQRAMELLRAFSE